ncbi:MAG: class I SAM-dependent methyltransferase [Candidatus Polarisedimenticolaceae bacterium]|nr:class I SAM-dependent methyltransferase [Candidatus Polarisedimenticolaceae bacterium]
MDDAVSNQRSICPICGGEGWYAYTGSDLLMGLPGQFSYDTCCHCGAAYQVPMPSLEQITSFYPDEYAPYKTSKVKVRNPIEQSVLRACYGYQHLNGGAPNWLGSIAGLFAYRDLVPYIAQGRMLDVGCGGGKFLRSMQTLGWQAQGVEFNPSAVATCRAAGLEVSQGELSDANLPDNHFDLITARHVIEHIADPQPLLAEIFRLLKPGGLMLLRTPNSEALGRRWFGTNWYADDIPRHLILFSGQNLTLLAEQHGFKRQAIKRFSSIKVFLNSWDYHVGNKPQSSKKSRWHRLLARLYIWLATITGRGDELFVIFQKPKAG